MAKWSDKPWAQQAPETRYYLDCDDSSHSYIIPVNRREDFEAWVDSGEEEVPDYAQEIGGSPNFVTFTDPKIDL